MKESLVERVQQLGLHLYQSTTDEDILIAQWWDDLRTTGEMDRLIAASARSLSAFYSLFRTPNMMVYTVRDEEMESVHWAEPVSSSPYAVFFSSWAAPSLRGTKRQAVLMTTIYELLLSMGRKTIIGITKQEQLLSLHEGLGYVIVGPIPNLFDEHQAWIMYLDKHGLETSRLYAAANKINHKESDKWVVEEKAKQATQRI